MATIYDLFEVTSISAHTTYSEAAGNLLGIVDGASSSDLDDGEFDEGDSLTIGGVTYTIDLVQEPLSSGRFTLGDGTNLSFDPGSESNLSAVFLTVSNGSDFRYFIIPNDSYGDMNVAEIRTGDIEDVAGNDAAIISTTDNNTQVVCFTRGTRIATPCGDAAVENIRPGTLVMTRDNGPQPVEMVLVRKIELTGENVRHKPIAIDAGALAEGRPQRRLCVSPQHRVLIADGTGRPVLVPAKALVGRRGIRVMRGKRAVTYYHIAFRQHEIVESNGLYTESFYPGPVALNALPDTTRQEILEVFNLDGGTGTTARPSAAAPLLAVGEVRRSAWNGRHFYSHRNEKSFK